ncbi:MAG: hypothetical protein PVJ70_10620, partial [Syntrophobacterales bacterium]
MELFRQRGISVLFAIAALAIFGFLTICPVRSQVLPFTQSQSARSLRHSPITFSPHYAQADRQLRIAVYTFNILN